MPDGFGKDAVDADPFRLRDNGYSPLPIPQGGKACYVEDWPRYCAQQPTGAEIDAWKQKWPACGWGIACGPVVGIDIDELDPDRAREIATHAFDVLGYTPAIRIGRAPKRMLVYRAEGPITSSKLHHIEVLSTGNQFVGFAIHPDTDQPYRWPGQSLLDLKLDDLPAVTQAQIDEFLAPYAPVGGRGSSSYQAREWKRDPKTGLIVDGREDFLRHCVYQAFLDRLDDGDVSPDAIATGAWNRFEAEADLSRRKTNGRYYSYRDAISKARGITGKYNAGKLRHPRLLEGIKPEPWPEELTVEDASDRLKKEVQGFFERIRPFGGYRDGPPRSVIQGAAGLGKSRSVLDAIASWMQDAAIGPPFVWFAVPRIELAHELADHYGPNARVIRGRTHGYDPQRHAQTRQLSLCSRPEAVVEAARSGVHKISEALCYRRDDNGTAHSCPYYDSCGWYAQFYEAQDVEVYFLAHEYLMVTISDRLLPRPNLLVIDEDILQVLVANGPGFGPEQLEGHEIGDLLLAELRAGRDPRPAVIGAGWTKARLKKSAQRREEACSIEISPAMPDDELLKRLNRHRPPVLARVLRRLADELHLKRPGLRSLIYTPEAPVTFEDGGGGTAERFSLCYRRNPKRIRKDLPVLMLDATADVELLRPAIPGLEVIEIHAQRNAEVRQTYGFTASMKCLTGDDQKYRDEIADLAKRHGENGLMVTYKDAKDRVPLPKGWAAEHFGNLRGLDRHKGRTVIIVTGRLQVPAAKVEAFARGLFYDSEEQLETTGEYERQAVGFRMRDGQHIGVKTWRHRCPIVDRVRRQLTEAEIIQAVDRLRLVHRDDMATVILINEVPTLPVDQLVSYRAFVRRKGKGGAGGGAGVRLAEAFEWLGGFLPTDASWLAEKFPDLWGSKQAAEAELKRTADIQANLYNNIIRNWPVIRAYQYRRKGQRGARPSVCWSSHSAGKTRAFLEQHFGELVVFEGPVDRTDSSE